MLMLTLMTSLAFSEKKKKKIHFEAATSCSSRAQQESSSKTTTIQTTTGCLLCFSSSNSCMEKNEFSLKFVRGLKRNQQVGYLSTSLSRSVNPFTIAANE